MPERLAPNEMRARQVRRGVATGVAALRPRNLTALGRNLTATARSEPWRDYVRRHPEGTTARMAERALGWICRSQDRVGRGGVADLSFRGWTPGYPEVTGYIIPTFWDYHHLLGRGELADRAVRMADWELRLQKPSGGFESLYEGWNQPPVVFNTGQVIRGLLRTHEETGEERYLEAAIRAGDWIVANQERDGSWAEANYLGMARTYDTYAAAGLAQLALSRQAIATGTRLSQTASSRSAARPRAGGSTTATTPGRATTARVLTPFVTPWRACSRVARCWERRSPSQPASAVRRR